MDAAIQQHRGVPPIGHAESQGAGQAGEHDFARRRAPRDRMSLPPAEPAPVDTRIEWRPAIVADPRSHQKYPRTVRCHLEHPVNFWELCKKRAYCDPESGSNAAAT